MSVTTAAAERLAARNLKKAEAEASKAAKAEAVAEKKAAAEAAKAAKAEAVAEKKAAAEAAKAVKIEAAAEKKAESFEAAFEATNWEAKTTEWCQNVERMTETTEELTKKKEELLLKAGLPADATLIPIHVEQRIKTAMMSYLAAEAKKKAATEAAKAAEAKKKADAELVKTAMAYLDNLQFHPDFPPCPEEPESETEEAEAEEAEAEEAEAEATDAKTRTKVLAHIAAGLELAKQDIPDIDEFPNIQDLEYAMASVSHAKLVETFRGLAMKFNNSKPESYKRVFVAFVTAMNARKLKMGEKYPVGPTNDELKSVLRVSHVNQAPNKAGLVERIKMLINGFDKFLDICQYTRA